MVERWERDGRERERVCVDEKEEGSEEGKSEKGKVWRRESSGLDFGSPIRGRGYISRTTSYPAGLEENKD